MVNHLTSQEPQSGAAVNQSLMTDLSNCYDHARAILGAVQSLADTLHGSTPREAENAKGAPEPQPTMRRHVDHLQAVLTDIDHELRAIGNRL
jgi:hypothetical protein